MGLNIYLSCIYYALSISVAQNHFKDLWYLFYSEQDGQILIMKVLPVTPRDIYMQRASNMNGRENKWDIYVLE